MVEERKVAQTPVDTGFEHDDKPAASYTNPLRRPLAALGLESPLHDRISGMGMTSAAQVFALQKIGWGYAPFLSSEDKKALNGSLDTAIQRAREDDPEGSARAMDEIGQFAGLPLLTGGQKVGLVTRLGVTSRGEFADLIETQLNSAGFQGEDREAIQRAQAAVRFPPPAAKHMELPDYDGADYTVDDSM
jgi:hypothetical protein